MHAGVREWRLVVAMLLWAHLSLRDRLLVVLLLLLLDAEAAAAAAEAASAAAALAFAAAADFLAPPA